MAKRKAVKIDDTQRTLEIRSPSTSVSGMTAHVPDLLMRANRRQYQQSRAYDLRVKVANTNSNVQTQYEIYTLSNAWWVKRAIEMAKGVYMDATKKTRALLGNDVAKYNDFIVQANVGAAGNFADLYQYSPAASGDDMTAAEVTSDETLYESSLVSDLKDDDGDTMGFTTGGEDTTGPGVFNIFDQYLLSRSITPDADTRAGPYADLFGVDEDAIASLQQDGDLTPWDADAFPSPFVLADTIGIDRGNPGMGNAEYSKLITAPLGIVIIKKFSDAGSEASFAAGDRFLLDVRKGTYKGVHAPAYVAMKGPHRGIA